MQWSDALMVAAYGAMTQWSLVGICYFSAKYTALRRKSKDWLAQNQDNVSEWGDMSIRGLLFQRDEPSIICTEL